MLHAQQVLVMTSMMATNREESFFLCNTQERKKTSYTNKRFAILERIHISVRHMSSLARSLSDFH